MQLRNISQNNIFTLFTYTLSPLIVYIAITSTEIKPYEKMIRLNYLMKLVQHPLKMWQHNSRCMPPLNPASWRKEQLELFPTAS